MGGDYLSSDFDIKEDGGLRLVLHAPTGMTIESKRLPADPIAVSSDYSIKFEGDVARPGEVANGGQRAVSAAATRNGSLGSVPRSPSATRICARKPQAVASTPIDVSIKERSRS
jgi:hypothetical protein